MRLAILDQRANPGGSVRYLRALILNLKAVRPEAEIVLFIDEKTVFGEDYDDIKGACRIRTMPGLVDGLAARSIFSPHKSRLRWIASNFKHRRSIEATRKGLHSMGFRRRIVRELNAFNCVYLPWPFLLRLPRGLTVPVVATFHDFNWKHGFPGVFMPAMVQDLERQTPDWLRTCSKIVVSSDFILSELEHYYPEYASKATTVRLSNFNTSRLAEGEAREIVAGLGVPRDYILYPANVCAHKNVDMLVEALGLMEGERPVLVLTGPGMDDLAAVRDIGESMKRSGLVFGKDILGLGYVGHNEIDALLQEARAVVSPSLYEAGCGPGLEAWALGVPVVFSNIPSFIEHLEKLGVYAYVFDPASPKDIASKIGECMRSSQKTREMVKASKKAMASLTWDKVACEYWAVFDRASGKLQNR
ncbi:MAG: glycosyltransferase [Chloroflexi bacterium]|nr:glycosyltransferase [Chloroflexota bacterium]